MLDALLFAKTPSLLSAVYRECIWKVKTDEKILYLTFDDGPIDEVTPFVLDELKRYNAKATFFCIGKNVDANPEIFQRIIEEGHAIGNHSYDHLNGWNCDNETYFENISRCHEVLIRNSPDSHREEIRNLFRPPYGKLKPAQYKYLKQKYRIVMWDVLSFDFDLKMDEDKVLNNVTDNAGPGCIVVFHDSLKAKPKLEYALPRTLEHFSAKGFKFEKLC
jgi:peptidoglycan/xylan/chitin deacetylase (PgdA/CDA1 family)